MSQPKPNKIHHEFQLNGNTYDHESLRQAAVAFKVSAFSFEKELGTFILDWLSPDTKIILQTSGTTGSSKKFPFDKQALVNSALTTGEFFKLQPGQKALHCLPAKYIAGKMMLVRALVLGLHLDVVPPSSTPLKESQTSYDFVAMTPFQAEHSIGTLTTIKTLIIGGGAVAIPLKKALLDQNVNAFETYGMTETLSHIAVRKMNAPSAQFTVLPNVSIRQDHRNCLVIDAPHLGVENLITNDEIEQIAADRFRLIGRIDHVVNSGGIKLHPEVIESKISDALEYPFFIGGIADTTLGERLVLAVVASSSNIKEIVTALNAAPLDSYERPKSVLFYEQFQKTATGKIKRKETLQRPYTHLSNLK
ncbi:AMP-binding protein [Flavobacteriaceae bacterium]|nr:AMP-binding protein [Flavobacteriaceae bacterium]